jgi:ABC-type glycerol-3-phosphate transport system substrate-binding protein
MRAERVRAAASALALALAVAAFVPSQPAAAHETVREWSLSARDASTVSLRIVFDTYEANGSHRVDMNTSTVPYATIRGLTAADVAAPSAEKSFEIA